MKKAILTLSMIAVLSTAFAQSKDTVTIRIDTSYMPDYNGIILYDSPAKILIIGDTTKAIKSALEQIRRSDSILVAYYEFMKASVAFSNQVSDYWKTKEHNCAWQKYYGIAAKERLLHS
jgi:hypothetical protein